MKEEESYELVTKAVMQLVNQVKELEISVIVKVLDALSESVASAI